MDEQEHRRKIDRLETEILDAHIRKMKEILKGIELGVSGGQRLHKAWKKKRYLEALTVYDGLGLTPSELSEKTRARVWLWIPGERPLKARLKTVSMSLHRLVDSGLARRKKDGREYRYFITRSGRNRLDYYHKTGQ